MPKLNARSPNARGGIKLEARTAVFYRVDGKAFISAVTEDGHLSLYLTNETVILLMGQLASDVVTARLTGG